MNRLIKVRVIPRAPKNEVVKTMAGDILKIKLKAPPVDGKANEELIKFLSEEFKIAKSKIEIVKGKKGRNKVIEISD